MNTSTYVGRFAPSPTGPLHFGSFVAALASFLDARHRDGTWLLRIEDLDPPRESPTAAKEISDQLKALGLLWDGDVLYQSSRLDAYQVAFDKLLETGHIYPCTCSRRDVDPVYNGKCRNNVFDIDEPFAVRFRIDDREVAIDDRVMGRCRWHLEQEIGDFIIKRKDGLFAYQLAVVIDDAYQQITDIVRGVDLLDSTPRQLALADSLDLPSVRYAHIPVIVDDRGEKLSKQAHAQAVDTRDAVSVLRAGLAALGQVPPPASSSLARTLDRAVANWDMNRVPDTPGIAYKDLMGTVP
ncbi:MAG: tRNA glutamyl-Q(34) synthetase GluQRS [Pseudomonadales bacterium]|nr:tRNA glutamyl-Q(34) synthetase GluQRS [Pseudomonadales bacterium]